MTEQNKFFITDTIKWIKEKFKTERLLSQEEETILISLAQKGNQKAKERLLLSNMRFVIQVAAKYSNETLTQEELINEGAIGLLKALDYFDSSRGIRFISYAVWWIKASISRAISEKGATVRLPLNQQTYLHKALVKQQRGDILDATARELEAKSRHTLSLNCVINPENPTRLEDILPDEKTESPDFRTSKALYKKMVDKLLNKLPLRERRILMDLNSINREDYRSIREESRILGLSRERIRQLRDQGLRRLKALNYDGQITQSLNFDS